MDVELYVYDLSGGLARQYSHAIIGQQIDAIYHTAIVLNNIEYFFGQGIHRKIPGSTHHGRPMKVIKLGRTQLPMDTIEEYVQSLESIYTPESYDLFLHNCNNFTQDFSMFLVGKNIPSEISSLPETFLRTPIGQMLRSQIDQSMRTMTQAPDAISGTNARPNTNGIAKPKPTANGTAPVANITPAEFFNGKTLTHTSGHVWSITDKSTLDKLLKQAEETCAVIFFTSATCPPCKICYGPYDELADEAGDKATLIKVDLSQAYEIGSKYSVRATPTFMTFLHGKKYEEWSGADPSRLRGSVRMLIQMAQPQHPHFRLNTPNLHGLIRKPILYTRIPPLEKLAAKLGAVAADPAIKGLITYIKSSTEQATSANTPIPDLASICNTITTSYTKVPITERFALVDLLRIATTDSRVASYLATETSLKTLSTILTPAGTLWTEVPFQMRLVTCQLACNLFSSPIFQELVSQPSSTARTCTEALADCLIAENANARSAAAAVVYNLAAINHNERVMGRGDLFEVSDDVGAALATAVFEEKESKECLRSQLSALGMMLYGVGDREGSTIWQLCESLEMVENLKEKAREEVFKGEGMLREVVELLGKGRS